MEVVHARYDKLSRVIESLNVKTKELLLQERKEFLAAYRAHTYKIQLELRHVRKRVMEEKSSEQQEDKLKQIREDHEWFRDEAINKERLASSMAKDLSAWKEKLDISEEKVAWLINEIKITKTHVANLKQIQFGDDHTETETPQLIPPASSSMGDYDDDAPARCEALRREKATLERLVEDQRILCRRSKRAINRYRGDLPSTACVGLRRAFVDAVALVTESRRLQFESDASLVAVDDADETSALLKRLADLGIDKFTPTDRLTVLAHFARTSQVQHILRRSLSDHPL